MVTIHTENRNQVRTYPWKRTIHRITMDRQSIFYIIDDEQLTLPIIWGKCERGPMHGHIPVIRPRSVTLAQFRFLP